MRTRLAILAFFLTAGPARAWDSHGELTRLALAGLPGMSATAPAETLEEYLTAAAYPGGAAAFLTDLKLNPRTRFAFRTGETSGAPVSLLAVAAAYADEPDWEMDNEMFTTYPELWRDAYRFMVGAPRGLQTRAVRHMHWPRGYLSPPAPGGNVPVHNAEALGLADERAELYFKLSRQAFAEGHPYWGARFLAWSLHYVEDLTQPFHAIQLPAFEMLQLKPGGGIDLERTTRAVAYYHLAFDGIAGASYRGDLGPGPKALLENALAGASTKTVVSVKGLAVDTAMEASGKAKRAALAALDFFPAPTDADLADPVARVWGGGYWAECKARIAADPAASEAFFGAIQERLEGFGPRARGLAAAALEESGKPKRLERAKLLERMDRIIQNQRAIIP